MDVDTTSGKMSHSDLLNKFKDENIDILIGTQMVAKGLDFPNVTLVGVLAADMGLNMNDFRSGERTFDLITQVCGRAGRGDVGGRAIVQTYTPDNSVIQRAKKQDYLSFYNDEIFLRQTLRYPPFCEIISLLFTSTSNGAASIYSKKIRNYIERALFLNGENGVEVLGPVLSDLSRINNKYRWRIIIKCKMNNNIRMIINNLIKTHYKTKESKWKEWDQVLQGLAKEVEELGSSVFYSEGTNDQEEAGLEHTAEKTKHSQNKQINFLTLIKLHDILIGIVKKKEQKRTIKMTRKQLTKWQELHIHQ